MNAVEHNSKKCHNGNSFSEKYLRKHEVKLVLSENVLRKIKGE